MQRALSFAFLVALWAGATEAFRLLPKQEDCAKRVTLSDENVTFSWAKNTTGIPYLGLDCSALGVSGLTGDFALKGYGNLTSFNQSSLLVTGVVSFGQPGTLTLFSSGALVIQISSSGLFEMFADANDVRISTNPIGASPVFFAYSYNGTLPGNFLAYSYVDSTFEEETNAQQQAVLFFALAPNVSVAGGTGNLHAFSISSYSSPPYTIPTIINFPVAADTYSAIPQGQLSAITLNQQRATGSTIWKKPEKGNLTSGLKYFPFDAYAYSALPGDPCTVNKSYDSFGFFATNGTLTSGNFTSFVCVTDAPDAPESIPFYSTLFRGDTIKFSLSYKDEDDGRVPVSPFASLGPTGAPKDTTYMVFAMSDSFLESDCLTPVEVCKRYSTLATFCFKNTDVGDHSAYFKVADAYNQSRKWASVTVTVIDPVRKCTSCQLVSLENPASASYLLEKGDFASSNLTREIISYPSHGYLAFNGTGVTYFPFPYYYNMFGNVTAFPPDRFTYRTTRAPGEYADSNVTILVTEVCSNLSESSLGVPGSFLFDGNFQAIPFSVQDFDGNQHDIGIWVVAPVGKIYADITGQEKRLVNFKDCFSEIDFGGCLSVKFWGKPDQVNYIASKLRFNARNVIATQGIIKFNVYKTCQDLTENFAVATPQRSASVIFSVSTDESDSTGVISFAGKVALIAVGITAGILLGLAYLSGKSAFEFFWWLFDIRKVPTKLEVKKAWSDVKAYFSKKITLPNQNRQATGARRAALGDEPRKRRTKAPK